MVRSVIVLLLSTISLAWSANFRLVSETWTSDAPGTSGASLTRHTYDDHGFRTASRSWVPDTTGSLATESFFSYDGSGRLVAGATRIGSDTTSSFRNIYSNTGLLVATEVFGRVHAAKYVDSFTNPGPNRSTSWRTAPTGIVLWSRHVDSIAGAGRSDTLFEPDSLGRLAASQASVDSLDGSGAVANRREWLRQDGIWYNTRTTWMSYSGGRLAAAASFQADGASRILEDSLDFAYDTWGNRLREAEFDGNRQPFQSWTYVWIAPPTTSVGNPATTRTFVARGRRMEFPDGIGTFAVADARGTVLWSVRPDAGTTTIEIPASLRPGRYIALVATGSGPRGFPILVAD